MRYEIISMLKFVEILNLQKNVSKKNMQELCYVAGKYYSMCLSMKFSSQEAHLAITSSSEFDVVGKQNEYQLNVVSTLRE